MSETLSYIQAHLDEPLTPHRLAEMACYSLQHFHRVFRAVVGESVMDHIRRMRLEKAAYRLKASREPVGSIALDAGYAAQEAFTRIFQAYFGIGPRMFRYAHAPHFLPSASGVHFSPSGCTPLKRAVAPELLEDSGLCAAHRHLASTSGEQLENLLSLVSGFYFAVLPLPYSDDPSRQLDNNMEQTLTDIDNEINYLLTEVDVAKERLAKAIKKRPKEQVENYLLKDSNGNDVRLSELFAGKDDLIVIHNMGASCIYCTIWADGITGLVPHFADRASLVVCSPDTPEVQRRFAEKRNWNFKMVSAAESSFTKDMGFWREDGPEAGPIPGLSTFRKEADGSINRVGKSFLGPAYDCAVWPLFDMLEGGANGWEPKFNYEAKA